MNAGDPDSRSLGDDGSRPDSPDEGSPSPSFGELETRAWDSDQPNPPGASPEDTGPSDTGPSDIGPSGAWQTVDRPPGVTSESLSGVDGGRRSADWPARIGRYEVLGEIAAGGMGVILEARDPQIGRRLAIKITRPGTGHNLVARFLAEGQITGQLQHPGVPPVHEIGQLPDGRPFLSMKLIRGRTLADLLAERPDPQEDLTRFIAVFEQICQTLAYAHDRGIIHRDLKPANVMVGAFGEVQVMDWGLAKLAEGPEAAGQAEASQIQTVRSDLPELASQAGTVLGTPSYMAPEQARGEAVDRRADVFGLGGILCSILTGKPPFADSSAVDAVARARAGDVTDLLERLEACGQPAELVSLARRCLEPSAYRRPADAAAVSEAVRDYVEGVAQRLKAAEIDRAAAEVRLAEERKRRRLSLALLTLVLGTVSAGVCVGVWYRYDRAYRAQRAAARAARIGDEIRVALDEAERLQRSAVEQVESHELWGATLAKAEALQERCQSLIREEPTLPDRALPERLEHLRSSLQADQADRRLVVGFEEIVQSQAANRPNHDYFLVADSYPRLKQLLSDYGITVHQTGEPEIRQRVASRPPTVRPYLLAALYEAWFLAGINQDESAADWFMAAYDGLDKTDWQNELMAAAKRRDLPAIRSLTEDPRLATEPSALIRRIARELRAFGLEYEINLLHHAQQQRLGDFWLNQSLGHIFLMEGSRNLPPLERHELSSNQRLMLEQAVRHLMVAAAARPTSAGAFQNLGLALGAVEDWDAAEAALRKALRLAPGSLSHYHNLAEMLVRRGQPREALTLLDEGVEALPDSGQLHNLRGIVLDLLGEADAAVAALRRAETAFEPSWKPVAQANLGQLLMRLGRQEEAIRLLRAAADELPDHETVHDTLGRALRDAGRHDEAVAAFRRQLEVHPALLDAHLNLAVELKRLGQLDEAEAHCQAALQQRPQQGPPSSAALVTLGGCRMARGDVPAAAEMFHFALLQATDYETRIRLSGELFDLGCYEYGRRAAQAAIRSQPDNPNGYVNLAATQLLHGDPREATRLLRPLLEWQPRTAAVHSNYAEGLIRIGQIEQALKVWENSRQNFELPSTTYFIGRCQLLLGDYSQALKTLEAVPADDPNRGHAARHRVLCHLLLGDVGAARQSLPAVGDPQLAQLLDEVESKPEDGRYDYLAGRLMQRGFTQLAIATLQRALTLRPKSASTRSNLGAAYMFAGRYEDALPLLEEASRLEGLAPRIAGISHSNLGACLIGLGRYEEALAAFQRATELAPELPHPRYHEGRARRALGQYREASEALRGCLQVASDYLPAHFELAETALDAGQYEEAVHRWTELFRGLPETHAQRLSVSLKLQESRRALNMEQQAPLMSSGVRREPGELLEIASALARIPGQRLQAASLYRRAFSTLPPRVAFGGDRYQAGKAALLALREPDGQRLDDSRRRSLRDQALRWLREELSAMRALSAEGVPPLRRLLSDEVRAWLDDPTLASTREPSSDPLAEADERETWSQFWDDVRRFAEGEG